MSVVYRAFDSAVDVEKSAEEKDGVITVQFIISTPRKDRAQDTIAVDGWVLDKYEANPVVLWAHDKSLPPIARAVKTYAKGKKLMSVAEFTPSDYAHPLGAGFGHTIGRMYKDGFLSTVSVGFTPKRWEERKDGIDFLEQELLEYSCVPIPMNPEAMVAVRGSGIDTMPIYRWCEMTLDNRCADLPPMAVSNDLVLETYKSLRREHSPTLMQRIFASGKKSQKEKEMDELKKAIEALTVAIGSQQNSEEQSELIGMVRTLVGNVSVLSEQVKELKEKQAAATPPPAVEPEVEQEADLEIDAKMFADVIAKSIQEEVAKSFDALE